MRMSFVEVVARPAATGYEGQNEGLELEGVTVGRFPRRKKLESRTGRLKETNGETNSKGGSCVHMLYARTMRS